MSHRVIVLPGARSDLLRLNAFLAMKNPRAAHRAMNAIEVGLRSLSTMPLRHAADTQGLRTLNIRFGRSGYVACYRVDGDTVVVARVFHMREDRD
ncbi:type II toxin-antitoxin system RelE/ParE family toxin [Brevundimonas sp.]|jgi:plasmid stabilization system protein ParE|uniref:type II toxin-antitoxin system RelE/ParE family toxin n=1 Tax=Brevundimonas sp. TaxID=1871086 RepID=UPI00391C0B24|nr:type II toxin-antitoxin system RelE/ParE family toxin [Brevundimonas sp.]